MSVLRRRRIETPMSTFTAVILRDVTLGMDCKQRRKRGREMWRLHRREGLSIAAIARRFSVDDSTVYRWVARVDEAKAVMIQSGRLPTP